MEEWRDIPGTGGVYQISISTKEGKCRSWKKGKDREPTVLSNSKNKIGRVLWNICVSGKKTCYQSARWIAKTFPELVQNEYFEGAEIDHIDTDKTNNHPSNLRWVDRKGNMNNPTTLKHSSESQKGEKGSFYGKHHTSKTKKTLSDKQLNRKDESKPIHQLDLDGNIINTYLSGKEAMRKTGINQANISHVCCGKAKTSGGYRWEFAS